MRIISGRYRGRVLKSTKGFKLRPTADRVRESYFNIIGQFFSGARILDLYCGTGAIGLEFLSRGAGLAVFVDESAESISIAKANAREMGILNRCVFYTMSAEHYMQSNKREVFDYIYLDPPYRENISSAILKMVDNNVLSTSGILTVEHSKRTIYPDSIGELYLSKRRRYGDTVLSFYTFDPISKERI